MSIITLLNRALKSDYEFDPKVWIDCKSAIKRYNISRNTLLSYGLSSMKGKSKIYYKIKELEKRIPENESELSKEWMDKSQIMEKYNISERQLYPFLHFVKKNYGLHLVKRVKNNEYRGIGAKKSFYKIREDMFNKFKDALNKKKKIVKIDDRNFTLSYASSKTGISMENIAYFLRRNVKCITHRLENTLDCLGRVKKTRVYRHRKNLDIKKIFKPYIKK